MYMNGFTWTSVTPDQTCITFLWPGLVIDRLWKLVLSCIGVVLISACVELVTLARRGLSKPRQRDAGLIFHVISLIFAYTAMLFIMTYSIELFLSAILGLTLGHVLTRWLSERLGALSTTNANADASELETGGTPCCALSRGLGVPGGVRSESVMLQVSGMTCEACVHTVRGALEAVPGVVRVQVSLPNSSALVTFDPPANIECLSKAVDDVGFDAFVRAPSLTQKSAAVLDHEPAGNSDPCTLVPKGPKSSRRIMPEDSTAAANPTLEKE